VVEYVWRENRVEMMLVKRKEYNFACSKLSGSDHTQKLGLNFKNAILAF